MTQVEPAPRLRFRVAHDVDRRTLSRLDVIHVGQSSALLGQAAPGRRALVPVTWAGRGLAPGGFALDAGDGALLRPRLLEAQRAGARLDLRAWTRTSPGRGVVTDLRLPAFAIDPEATSSTSRLLADAPPAQLDHGMGPARQRAQATPLAAAVMTGDAASVRALTRDLIGSGPGATPAGDDVVLGVLAALRLAAGGDLLDERASAARRALDAAVLDSLDRTTAVSSHQLGAALRGSFAERLLTLTRAVTDRGAVRPVHAAALEWGATSGIDFLHGLVSTAQAVLVPRALAASA